MEAIPNPEGAALPPAPPPRRRFNPVTIAAYTLSALLGGVFLFSAVAKLFPITGFEWLIRDSGLVNATGTALLSRLLIALELLLGLCLLFSYRLRSFTLPVSAIFVLVLSAYLAYRIRLQGGHGNCGCFGDALPMTPVEALIKNGVLLLLFGVVFALAGNIPRRGRKGAAVLLGVVLTATVFALQPPKGAGAAFRLSPLTANAGKSVEQRLGNGRHVLAFMSYTCPHCRVAAKKMAAMYREDPRLPFYLVLSGDKRMAADFFAETGATTIPHQHLEDPDYLREVTGGYVPAIIWIENGREVRKMGAGELRAQTVRNWAFGR